LPEQVSRESRSKQNEIIKEKSQAKTCDNKIERKMTDGNIPLFESWNLV
jgi:hypothetical protein